MRTLSATELLQVWERGLRQLPFQRALALLAAACPDESADALAELSIGQRDSRLLTLRAWTFGPKVASVARCPVCAAQVDLLFCVDDIRAAEPQALVFALPVEDYIIELRLPNSRDLGALVAEHSEQVLLKRCLLSVARSGQPCNAGALPPEVVRQAVEQLALADPQADVQLALVCPVCGHPWQAPFDIVSFFWSEIDAWAGRMFREIHALALAYGWREEEILALSPLRRRMYLEMIGV
ncbi:MAG: hypothetical protein OHK0022_31510 [Roseiflexaceae bacterium]